MSRWRSQHDGLQELGPPYVYNVFKGDTAGFVQAFKDALSNPIDRYACQTVLTPVAHLGYAMTASSYVPERTTMSAVEKRLAAILERDWAAEAEQSRTDDQGEK